jgi:hypothetical protein
VFAETTLPTTVPSFFSCHVLDLSGSPEVEGGAGSLAVDVTRRFYVLVLGPHVPAAGDDLLASWAAGPGGGRWVAECGPTGAPSGGTSPCSPCAIPERNLKLVFNYRGYTAGAGGYETSVTLTLIYHAAVGATPASWSCTATIPDYLFDSGGGPVAPTTAATHSFTLDCEFAFTPVQDPGGSGPAGNPTVTLYHSCSGFSQDVVQQTTQLWYQNYETKVCSPFHFVFSMPYRWTAFGTPWAGGQMSADHGLDVSVP